LLYGAHCSRTPEDALQLAFRTATHDAFSRVLSVPWKFKDQVLVATLGHRASNSAH